MKDIIISNKEEFKKKKDRVAKDGLENLFVVSDFDRTLTKAFHGKRKVTSLVAALRESDYLGNVYMQKAKDMFKRYHPYEIDMTISLEEKNQKMEEWWRTHNEMFIEYGLNKDIIDDIVKKRKVGFREGAKNFFKSLNQKKIPLIIVSASSLGMAIDDYMKKNKVYYKNTKIITNYFIFDDEDMVVGFEEPVVTTTNKYLVIKEHLPELVKINGKKKNIILLGDNYEDQTMSNSFEYEDAIKIGFLNENIDACLDVYKDVYDVVVLNDGSMDFPNKLLEELS